MSIYLLSAHSLTSRQLSRNGALRKDRAKIHGVHTSASFCSFSKLAAIAGTYCTLLFTASINVRLTTSTSSCGFSKLVVIVATYCRLLFTAFVSNSRYRGQLALSIIPVKHLNYHLAPIGLPRLGIAADLQ
uniref:Uncharacterized protein n=1 Tax=Glossina austeni TaxID=7395 RepID=A0A1A9VQJ8_GLOAU